MNTKVQLSQWWHAKNELYSRLCNEDNEEFTNAEVVMAHACFIAALVLINVVASWLA